MILTGIGSRKAPKQILKDIAIGARLYSERGFRLRSGAAKGCDTAFESAWSNNKEIYVPSPRSGDYIFVSGENMQRAYEMACNVSPHIKRCDQYVKDLHTRNVFQILGEDLNEPSDVVVMYAEPVNNKNVKGGTNTAYRIAQQFNVMVLNLYYEDDTERFLEGKALGLLEWA